MFRFRTVPLLLALGVTSITSAATYYVDPAVGKMTNPGTAASPWSTLEAVFLANKTFTPGDTLVLRNGYHGAPSIKGLNSGHVFIQPQAGHTAKLKKLYFASAAYWTVTGLDISPLHAGATAYDTGRLVETSGSAHHITVKDCRIRSAFSVTGWTENDWKTKVAGAVLSRAPYSVFTGNQVENVAHGIYLMPSATYSTVSYNVIDGVRDDGFRGVASHSSFEYNTLTNMYAVDGNHDDAFQSYSIGSDGSVGTSVVRNVVLRGNVFISQTDPKQPFKASMQGIGCFDGMFEGWVIENNVIVTDSWHGIALYGARNCRIVNNTVVKNPLNAHAATPWIQISPHKNGTVSSGNIVRNNLTTRLNVTTAVAALSHNLTTTTYGSFFVDWTGFNLQLKSGSPAIGTGTATSAPSIDADKRSRSVPYDIGAYEYTGSVATTPTAAIPVASPKPGAFTAPVSVALASATAGATIRYTTDGSTPSATHGLVYVAPILLSKTAAVKALTIAPNHSASAVTTGTYTIGSAARGVSVSFESDALVRTASGAPVVVQNESSASGGKMLYFDADSVGDSIEFTTGTVQPGSYVLKLRVKRGGNRGQHSVHVGGTTVGSTIDHFSSAVAYADITVGPVTVGTAGAQKIRLTVTGRASGSRGYVLAPDAISFIAQ